MQLGIYFNEGLGVPLGANAALYRVPECLYFDAQHAIWASGGVAQYEINQFLNETQQRGLQLTTTGEWLKLVRCPGNMRWKPDLARRCPGGNGTHIRGFASEMLLLVSCLVAFGDAALTDAMPAHVACLRFLYTIQVLILMGDRLLAHLALLEELLAAHHDLFLALYGECAKPKLHYMRHLARLLGQFKKVLTCFGPERHHRNTKRMAAFCFREMTCSLLRNSLVLSLQALQEPARFVATKLLHPCAVRQTRSFSCRHLLNEHGLRGSARGRELRTAVGLAAKGDFVLYRRFSGPLGGVVDPWETGVVVEFWQAAAGAATDHYAVVDECESRREIVDASWEYRMPRPRRRVLVHHARLLFLCAVFCRW